MAKNSEEGIFINDIVKEYPNVFKIIIYHEGYYLPTPDGRQSRKQNKKQRREDSIHRSLRRTKTTIKDLMACNKFDYWCTFTYNCRSCYPKCTNNPCTCSPSTCKRFDVNYTRRVLQNWFRNQKKHSPSLKYLAVPEFHKNGAIHFHCMLGGFYGRLKDSGKKTKNGQTIYNASGYYSGFTEFVKIGERFDADNFDSEYQRVISYITKYITKDMPLVYGRRRFLISNNLKRPVTTVNGVRSFRLSSIIRNKKPEFINDRLEIQKHEFSGKLTASANFELF